MAIGARLFTSIDDTDKVTADDVMRVAKEYLVPETRTVVYTVPPPRSGETGRRRAMRTLILSLRALRWRPARKPKFDAPSRCLPTRI